MKRRNGFTLIELLAVIVILAIIAVIATPIIVGTIEDSRKAAFERSVDGIIKATELDFGIQESLDNNIYEIEDGQVTNVTLKVPIKNLEGYNGTIKFDQNGNSEYAIYNDKWCMTKTNSVITTTEYVEDECILNESGENETQDVSIDGNPIYFDVVYGEGCSVVDYHEDNSKTEYNGTEATKTTNNQNGCLKFYAFGYEEGDTVVNLLLDHNTTALALWNDDESSCASTDGPTTILTELQNDTSSWNGTETPADYSSFYNNSIIYTIDYDNDDDTKDYKARLITANEVAQITGADEKEGLMFDEKITGFENYFHFDSLATTESSTCKSGNISGCQYGWLYDRIGTNCKISGCLNNSDVSSSAYWTSTSVSDIPTVWAVGILRIFDDVPCAERQGVRPVIEVLISKL